MAQQAPLEPGSALYEFALNSIDLTKVPEKLKCKSCANFLLNGFKTACCEDGICEVCTTIAAGSACPICKHAPLVTNIGKALRATGRNYLKNQMASADATKQASAEASKAPESTPSLAIEPKESSFGAQEVTGGTAVNGSAATDQREADQDAVEAGIQEKIEEQSEEVVQSIEEPRASSRRPTIDSASDNEPDDIEINVGPEYDLSQIVEASKRSPVDDAEPWPEEQNQDKNRNNSTLPSQTHPQNHTQNQNQSFNGSATFSNEYDNTNGNVGPNMNQGQNDQQLWDMMQSNGANNMNPMFAMMQNQPMMQQMMQQMQHMQSNGMMQNYPGMQYMQSMGIMPQMGMNSQNQNWPGNMLNVMNSMGSNFSSMMNNGASFNNSQQQYQQNYQNGDYRFNRNGSFDRGRGRGRGRNKFRGGYNNQFAHQDQYGAFNNMPFQTQYPQGSTQQQQGQYDSSQPGTYSTNNEKETEQPADEEEFAPGGQDEVQEALGDSYKKKESAPPEELKVEEPPIEGAKQEEYQPEPSSTVLEQSHTYESPKQDPKEEYIPEAYREDLDFASAPLTAPLGPASKDVPYRARGHGRFPSRGRGSYQGSVAYPPRSPARPVSQHQTNSPPTNQGHGVIGAPTGPRAMREKEAPLPKTAPRSESDAGFKIRGTATQAKDQRAKEDQRRSVTPRSTYDVYEDRDKDSSRRHNRIDRKHETSRSREYADEYDDERDRRRRKSRREGDNDHDMQDAEYSRSDSQDRTTSHRSGRKDKDRTRDKQPSSSSKHRSSRKYEDEYDDRGSQQGNDYGNEVANRTKPKKTSSSKHDDRDERRDRDQERADKDKHRKRSRHDRDHDDGYEDADEEESRRRSRKHKKEHRKEREREPEASTDLGMRITGRSSAHRTSGAATPTLSTPSHTDKDPHTLEREARDRERMQKEQQRRQNAAANVKGLSGGRTRSFKYEDEIERSMNKPNRRR